MRSRYTAEQRQCHRLLTEYKEVFDRHQDALFAAVGQQRQNEESGRAIGPGTGAANLGRDENGIRQRVLDASQYVEWDGDPIACSDRECPGEARLKCECQRLYGGRKHLVPQQLARGVGRPSRRECEERGWLDNGGLHERLELDPQHYWLYGRQDPSPSLPKSPISHRTIPAIPAIQWPSREGCGECANELAQLERAYNYDNLSRALACINGLKERRQNRPYVGTLDDYANVDAHPHQATPAKRKPGNQLHGNTEQIYTPGNKSTRGEEELGNGQGNPTYAPHGDYSRNVPSGSMAVDTSRRRGDSPRHVCHPLVAILPEPEDDEAQEDAGMRDDHPFVPMYYPEQGSDERRTTDDRRAGERNKDKGCPDGGNQNSVISTTPAPTPSASTSGATSTTPPPTPVQPSVTPAVIPAPPPTPSTKTTPSSTSSNSWWPWVLALFGFLLIVALLWWWVSGRSGTTDTPTPTTSSRNGYLPPRNPSSSNAATVGIRQSPYRGAGAQSPNQNQNVGGAASRGGENLQSPGSPGSPYSGAPSSPPGSPSPAVAEQELVGIRLEPETLGPGPVSPLASPSGGLEFASAYRQ